MTRRMNFLAIVSLALSMGACRTVYDTAEKVTAASTIEHDPYEGTTWVKSPIVSYGDCFSQCFLRTLILDERLRINQLYVLYTSSDWAFLDRASDRQGTMLKTTVIDRDVSSGTLLFEHVAVELSNAYLEVAAGAGLDIQLRGKTGRTIVRLGPHYVQGFLDKLSRHGWGQSELSR